MLWMRFAAAVVRLMSIDAATLWVQQLPKIPLDDFCPLLLALVAVLFQ